MAPEVVPRKPDEDLKVYSNLRPHALVPEVVLSKAD